MAAIDLVSVSAILKRHYGPSPKARGRTYRDVLTFVEYARRRERSHDLDDDVARYARKLRLEYKLHHPLESVMYTEHPAFALFGEKPRRGRVKRAVDEADVERVQRGKHGGPDYRRARASFTPEEAERRRREAMGLDEGGCGCRP